MDVIDRNELMKKILEMMDDYLKDDWSDGATVCKKTLEIVVDMPSVQPDPPIVYPPGVRGNQEWWGSDNPPILTTQPFVYTEATRGTSNTSVYDKKITEDIKNSSKNKNP